MSSNLYLYYIKLLFCFRLFGNHGSLKSLFPTLYTILNIAITLPFRSMETERSFSKLKIINNRLRSTIYNNRLEFPLSKISILII